MRQSTLTFVFLLAALWCAEAQAYPQYVAKGYTNCGTCHYSPTGGGLLNSYGHATVEATFPDRIEVGFLQSAREVMAKNDVTGYDGEGAAAVHWDIGAESRYLILRAPTEVGGDPKVVLIPMLLELGGVIGVGPVLVYATVAPRRRGTGRIPNAVHSREHWLQYKLDETMSLRAGRMVLPFGLRIPDHSQSTREDFGFGKWQQDYALQWDRYTESSMLSVAAFLGDLVYEPTRRQRRGVAVSAALNFPGRGSVGASAMWAHRRRSEQLAASLFGRLLTWEGVYIMGELAAYHRWRRSEFEQSETAGFFRAGWFALTSLDLYAEVGGRLIRDAWELTKLRYMVGANWQLLPWVEFGPAGFLEEDVEAGRSYGFIAQLHIIY